MWFLCLWVPGLLGFVCGYPDCWALFVGTRIVCLSLFIPQSEMSIGRRFFSDVDSDGSSQEATVRLALRAARGLGWPEDGELSGGMLPVIERICPHIFSKCFKLFSISIGQGLAVEGVGIFRFQVGVVWAA